MGSRRRLVAVLGVPLRGVIHLGQLLMVSVCGLRIVDAAAALEQACQVPADRLRADPEGRGRLLPRARLASSPQDLELPARWSQLGHAVFAS